MFIKVSSILPKILKKYNLEDIASGGYICLTANKFSYGKYEAHSFKNGVLNLKVKNNILAQEIFFTKQNLISKINEELKQKIIRDIKFQVREN